MRRASVGVWLGCHQDSIAGAPTCNKHAASKAPLAGNWVHAAHSLRGQAAAVHEQTNRRQNTYRRPPWCSIWLGHRAACHCRRQRPALASGCQGQLLLPGSALAATRLATAKLQALREQLRLALLQTGSA